jgi:two-component system sensor histidine kinase/response regulator
LEPSLLTSRQSASDQLIESDFALTGTKVYAARHLTDLVRETHGSTWLVWLASGAVVDGIGTWSMHYTGMLAFILPVPVQYDWPTVLLSLAVSMVGSAAALVVVSYGTAEWPQAVAASILLGGVGISGMHYTAMAAMRVPATQHHAPALATVAVMVAMVISLLALWLTILVQEDNEAHRFRRHGSMLLRGDSQSGHALHRHGWCQLYRFQRNPRTCPTPSASRLSA